MTTSAWLQRCNRFSAIRHIVCAVAAFGLMSCKPATDQSSSKSGKAQSESQVEKVKPAPGTGNVQGKVLYNSKPAENIEVKLCETFSRFLNGCGGQIYTARTGKDGEYVITNVAPKQYEAVTNRVFETDMYVFATSGLVGISAMKYDVVAGKTFFVPPVHLFKGDLKTVHPKAGAKVSAQGLELKWEPYPDAAYYKVSASPDDPSIISPYISRRVEGVSFGLDQPLQKGTYRFEVIAFNKDDRKLSQSSRDIKFSVGE